MPACRCYLLNRLLFILDGNKTYKLFGYQGNSRQPLEVIDGCLPKRILYKVTTATAIKSRPAHKQRKDGTVNRRLLANRCSVVRTLVLKSDPGIRDRRFNVKGRPYFLTLVKMS